MKKTPLSLLLFCFLAGTAIAQQPYFLCGQDVFSDMIRRHHPELDESFRQTFALAAQPSTARSQEPLTVQVVLHVVWNLPEENLHDSILLDQMRILNEDFNRENADSVNLRPIFQAEAGSAGIRFELAAVNRVQTDVEFEVNLLGNNIISEVKHTDQGGSDAWDTESYLNIWVCKIQPITILGIELGQILGFAFPPNNLPHWPKGVSAPTPDEDGVVVDFRVFGSNNPNPVQNPDGGGPLVVKGRTPVHEVGHYLGLRHIWGDGGLLGPNDCNQSDGVDDTPYASSQSAFDCDVTRNTCTVIDEHYNQDMPDLIENFMDYAREDCMNMFTRGQINIMRNVLLGPRNGLLDPFTSTTSLPANIPFTIQPNPSRGPFALAFEFDKPTQATVIIRTMTGRVVASIPRVLYEAGRHQLDVDHPLAKNALYLVELVTESGFSTQRILVL